MKIPATLPCTVLLVVVVLAGCPARDDEDTDGGADDVGPGSDSGQLDAGDARDAGFVDASDCALFRLDDIDIGTHCGGAFVDVSLGQVDAAMTLETTDPLPDGLSLLRDEEGFWRVQGTAPAVDAAIDATFSLRVTSFDCAASMRVGMILDPCDGGDGTCGPFAEPHPIVGFCLPARVDANTEFAVSTNTSSCLSSTCSEVRPALCAIEVDGTRVTVAGEACVRDRLSGTCSEDCSGGDGAPCVIPPLAPGDYVMASAAGEVSFTVPFTDDLDPPCVYGF